MNPFSYLTTKKNVVKNMYMHRYHENMPTSMQIRWYLLLTHQNTSNVNELYFFCISCQVYERITEDK